MLTALSVRDATSAAYGPRNLSRGLLIGLSTYEWRTASVAWVEGELQVVVGRNIRRLREGLGLSQEQFGERVGWHRTFVGGVERGERNLTLKTIERLSDQLDVEALELLWDRDHIAVAADQTGELQVRRVGPRARRPRS